MDYGLSNVLSTSALTGLYRAGMAGVKSSGAGFRDLASATAAAKASQVDRNRDRVDIQAVNVKAAGAETADMSLGEYKQYIWKKISDLPMSASSRMQSISVQITDEGFEAMKNDPEYEAWVLDSLAQNFSYQNPWTAMCGGGYAVHHFGAVKEQYHGESWYPGYMGGQGAALFDKKSEGGFWEQRMERHKQYMELQQEAAAKRRMMMKLRMNGGTVSAAELLMGLF